MTVMTNEGLTLTDDEIATLDRFKEVLDDMGVQGKLAEQSAMARPYDGETSARIFNSYMMDVRSTESSEMHGAGVSLRALVELARSTDIFPSDFLPAQETVAKCIHGFWAGHRQSS